MNRDERSNTSTGQDDQNDQSGAIKSNLSCWASEVGQSLVEFTLLGMFLALVLVGIVDLGRAYFSKIALTDAAMEGAVYASYRPNCITSAQCPDPNNVTFRVQHATESTLVDWSLVRVEVHAPNPTSGNVVTVTVYYSYTLLTPFVSTFVGGDLLSISAQAKTIIQ